MAKHVSDEDLERFIEAYNRRREIRKFQEEEKRRQHNTDIYGIFAKYAKKSIDYRGKNK